MCTYPARNMMSFDSKNYTYCVLPFELIQETIVETKLDAVILKYLDSVSSKDDCFGLHPRTNKYKRNKIQNY